MFNIPLRLDLPMNYNFAVEIEGRWDAGFEKVEGMSISSEEKSIREVNNAFPHKKFIKTVNTDIILTCGLLLSNYFVDWWTSQHLYTKDGTGIVKDVSIVQLYRVKGQLFEVFRWVLRRAKIRGVKLPSFNALQGSNIAIEQAIIVYDGAPEVPYKLPPAINTILKAIQ